jgi:hypothetical protein
VRGARAPTDAAASAASAASASTVAAGTWIVRGNGEVRELHWPGTNAPDLRASHGVTGYAAGPDGTYIHIADGAARVTFDATGAAAAQSAAASNAGVPYIAQANGFVRRFTRTGNRLSFEFGGYYQPFVELANAQRCSVSVAGRPVAARRDGDRLRFDTAPAAGLPIDYQPVEVACGG